MSFILRSVCERILMCWGVRVAGFSLWLSCAFLCQRCGAPLPFTPHEMLPFSQAALVSPPSLFPYLQDRILWERLTQSRFAERPILKSLHVKFPSGPPAPADAPGTPSHDDMRRLVHHRRVYEEPVEDSGAGKLPSWGKTTPQVRMHACSSVLAWERDE